MRIAACLILVALSSMPALAQISNSAHTLAKVEANYGKLPLAFEANHGQSDKQVRYLSRGKGYSLFLTDDEAVLALSRAGAQKRQGLAKLTSDAVKQDVVRMRLAGANPGLKVTGKDQLPGIANYFIGNNPTKWHSNIPTYSKVSYSNVYPGIDLVYYGNDSQLEYDFVVAPGANPNQVRLHFAGASRLELTPDGNLRVLAKNGEIAFRKPVLYQEVNDHRDSIDGSFTLLANNTITFAPGPYDQTRPLVIDPTLEYSTYLGASGSDYATGIAVDGSGNAYVTGYTYSTAFPSTKNSYQPTSTYPATTSGSAVFVTKLNAQGSALQYSTYISGTATHCTAQNYGAPGSGDFGSAIAVNAQGDAFITGGTCANDFPVTKGAFQATYPSTEGGNNAFVTRLNSAGSGLLFSTYLGGQGNSLAGDWANAIAIDASGNSYLTGRTSSPDFPTTKNAFQLSLNNSRGYANAFVTKMNATGTALVYSSYLGGSGNGNGGDSGNGIAISSAGNAYITGFTYSQDFPVSQGAFQIVNNAYPNDDSTPFVTEINKAGTTLIYSTYLGGSGSQGQPDAANGIAIDSDGDAFVAGGTLSPDFPVTSGAFQTTLHTSGDLPNGFISKLNPTGSSLIYSTYLGGSGGFETTYGDRIKAISLDPKGDAYLTGFTGSEDFPLAGTPYQSTNKQYANNTGTAFLTELNPTGSSLNYSTFFGGSGLQGGAGDFGSALAYSAGNLYFAGATISPDFPITSGAFQKTYAANAGATNAFIAKFDFAASTTALVVDGNPEPAGATVTFTAHVTSATNMTAPTGTVSFAIDGTTPIIVNLDNDGDASYSTTTLAEGVHSVVASYSGDSLNLPSSASTTETIYGAAATLAVVSGSGQTSTINVAFPRSLVVLLKDAKGDVIPGATITYSGSGIKFSASDPVTKSSGEASVTATPTAAGSLTANAAYGTLKANFALTATGGVVAEPTGTQTVTIADATSGASVYYTTDGTEPTTSSTKYTGPITVTTTTTLHFIAVKSGDTSSPVRTIGITVQ